LHGCGISITCVRCWTLLLPWRARARTDTLSIVRLPMSLVLLPLIVALGICLVPIWLLPRQNFKRAQDYFIASQPTPPDVMRNSAVAYPLRIASFGPFFTWGASGDLWPAIMGAACCGLGAYMIYALRRPLLASLDAALCGDASATLPALVAKWHGNDNRVRLLTASLTVIALTGLITAEAFAAASLVQPVMTESARSVHLLAGGIVVLAVLYTVLAGNSGVMHSVQLQAGMIYLALFGSTALLLYFLVSDVSTLPPHGSFAVLLIGAACVLILLYRRFKFVDNTPIRKSNGRSGDADDGEHPSWLFRLLRRLEKAIDTFVSVFVILVVVLVAMEFSAFGVAGMARDSIAALRAGPGIPGMALLTIVAVSLLYPIVDGSTWQRLAALAKDTGSQPDLRSATIARIFNLLAPEIMLLLLLMCAFGAVAVVATETPADRDVLQTFIRQLTSEESLPASLAISLLVLGILTMALSAASSMLSASLWVLRYDLLPALWPMLSPEQTRPADEAIARRRTILVGCGLCIGAIFLVVVADALFGMSFTPSTFFAVLCACFCAQLSFISLVLTSLGLTGRCMGAVSAPWALLIIGVAAASGIAAVIVFLATGAEPWLWAAVPACLGSGLMLFAVARSAGGSPG
jgi:hypothetical protein